MYGQNLMNVNKNKLINKMKWIDFKKEFEIPFSNKLFQFELVTTETTSVKYILPGLGFTSRKKICFAVLLFIWNRRILFRFINDTSRADRKFSWKRRIK